MSRDKEHARDIAEATAAIAALNEQVAELKAEVLRLSGTDRRYVDIRAAQRMRARKKRLVAEGRCPACSKSASESPKAMGRNGPTKLCKICSDKNKEQCRERWHRNGAQYTENHRAKTRRPNDETSEATAKD